MPQAENATVEEIAQSALGDMLISTILGVGLDGMKAADDGISGWVNGKTADPGTGKAAGIKADTSLFDRSILKNFNQARKVFIDFAKKHFPSSVINAETGKEIGISRAGLDKFLSGNLLYEKYASGFHIPELIEKAHKVGQSGNYHVETVESIPTFEYYDSPIQIDGKQYNAHIRVKNTLVGDKYYGHTVSVVDEIKIEYPTRDSSPEAPAVRPENTGHSIS